MGSECNDESIVKLVNCWVCPLSLLWKISTAQNISFVNFLQHKYQLVWYQILVFPFPIDIVPQLLNKLNPSFINSPNWISLEQQGLDTVSYVPKIQNYTNCAVFLGKNFLMFHFIELENLLWFSFNTNNPFSKWKHRKESCFASK